MLPGILKCERVAILSEAQPQLQNSYPKILERPAKDLQKVAYGEQPPALQVMGDDIAFANRFWS